MIKSISLVHELITVDFCMTFFNNPRPQISTPQRKFDKHSPAFVTNNILHRQCPVIWFVFYQLIGACYGIAAEAGKEDVEYFVVIKSLLLAQKKTVVDNMT